MMKVSDPLFGAIVEVYFATVFEKYALFTELGVDKWFR
jgi:isocitrate dehydrogenase